MDIETIRLLTLARHLYGIGKADLTSANDMRLFSAVTLMHDAVEAFLLAIAHHTGAAIDQNTKFDKYLVEIDAKIAPNKLPFRNRLTLLNRIRIDSKHYGIQPARDECERLAIAVHEFFDEVSTSILGATFSAVSAIDLLEDGETKSVLRDAKIALESGQFKECSIACRKALFLEIERSYDISGFKDGDHYRSTLFDAFSEAPSHARNKQYVEKHVLEPTDFIVYDHSSINEKLLTEGVDNTAFWNVWRLTPKVYRTQDSDRRWVVKHEFHKLDEKFLSDKIEYIFSATLDVILSMHRTSQARKFPEGSRHLIDLTQENVPVYIKADKNSKVLWHTPKGMRRIETSYHVDGLRGDGTYWRVHHRDDLLFGFIHDDFVRHG